MAKRPVPIPDLPTMPGFEMSDEPFDEKPSPEPQDARQAAESVPLRPGAGNASTGLGEGEEPILSPDRPPNYGIAEATVPVRGNETHYESRIRILEAWQYPGSLKGAPGWIDPNWIGWVEYDEVRKLDAGPCLRVPISVGPMAEKIARKFDYVVKQEIVLSQGVSDVRLEVWERDDFQKFFMPVMPET